MHWSSCRTSNGRLFWYVCWTSFSSPNADSIDVLHGRPLDVLYGHLLDVLDGRPLDVLYGRLLDVLHGRSLDVLIGGPYDVCNSRLIDVLDGRLCCSNSFCF